MTDASRIALVTGAGSGVGKAAALALLAAGWRVALVGRRAEPLQEVAAQSGAAADRYLVVPGDVSDEASVQAMFGAVVSRFGRLDLLFNNAGVNAPGVLLEDLALEQWQAWWISALLMPVCALSAQTLARLMLWLGAWGFQPMGLVRAAIRLGLGLLLVGAMWVLHRVGIHQHITGEFLKLGFCLALSAWCVWRFAAVSELWHAHRRTQALTQALPSLLVFVIRVHGASFKLMAKKCY